MLCADSFVFKLIDTLSGLQKEVRTLKRDLTACEKANTKLQKTREAAEAREDATEGKLHLERQAREGMILESPCFLSNPTRGELIGTVLTGAEARLEAAVAALGQLTGKVSVVLAAFEPEGTAAAEELEARLEAARGRLGVFDRGGLRGCVPVHPGTREVPLPGGRLGAGE